MVNKGLKFGCPESSAFIRENLILLAANTTLVDFSGYWNTPQYYANHYLLDWRIPDAFFGETP